MNGSQIAGLFVRDQPIVEIGADLGEGHRAETRQQHRFGLVKGPPQRGVDRLLDKAAGRLRPVADG